MRILFLSNSGDGAWHALYLSRAGHDVDWLIEQQKYADALKGIISPPKESFNDPAQYDLIVFDDTQDGKDADELREFAPVIGNSEVADVLEHDRLAGIEFMEQSGIKVPRYEAFNDIGKATDWLKKQKRPTVFKPFGGTEDKATTYVSHSSEDMIRYLEKLTSKAKIDEFLLQEVVVGTEISTEAYFNGEDFFALNHTLEEKKFMSGGVGPNTGCAGTVVWMPVHHNALFEQGLHRSENLLRTAGFVGPIDLNTIVTEGEVFGLEWTPRFGYEGTCNLMQLLPLEFGEFMHMIASGQAPAVTSPKAAFAAAIRITVPPYPNPSDAKKYAGVPIKGIDPDDLDSFYLSDVMINDDDEMVTLGTDGLIGAPICVGDSIESAFEAVEHRIKKLQIPDLQWRNDVKDCCTKRYNKLKRDGWLRSQEAVSA